MDWQQGKSLDKHIQFIPAEKGWLALFEDVGDEEIKIHADPVIAWCLGAQDMDDGHHVVSFGQALIGASPWMDKADDEQSTHFFAVVREEQLDPDFVEEIKHDSRRSREDIMARARKNHADRIQGHATWRRQHRSDKSLKEAPAPVRIF